MLAAFSCSFTGKLLGVEYKLFIYVKHDAWNSWGDGEGMRQPITILQPPMQIPAPQPVVAPEGWAPQVYEQVVLD